MKNIIIGILVISVIFLLINNSGTNNKIEDNNTNSTTQKYSCQRTEPYKLEPEFERARSLRNQRFEQAGDKLDYDWYNCINVVYKDLPDGEGMFYFDKNSSIQNLTIFVDTGYKSSDDILTAILLQHEFTHVGQFINSLETGKETPCFESEAQAFFSEISLIARLNTEERKSLIQKNTALFNGEYKNNRMESAVNGVYQVALIGSKAAEFCKSSKAINYSECQDSKLFELLLEYVKSNIYYQKQCATQ